MLWMRYKTEIKVLHNQKQVNRQILLVPSPQSSLVNMLSRVAWLQNSAQISNLFLWTSEIVVLLTASQIVFSFIACHVSVLLGKRFLSSSMLDRFRVFTIPLINITYTLTTGVRYSHSINRSGNEKHFLSPFPVFVSPDLGFALRSHSPPIFR